MYYPIHSNLSVLTSSSKYFWVKGKSWNQTFVCDDSATRTRINRTQRIQGREKLEENQTTVRVPDCSDTVCATESQSSFLIKSVRWIEDIVSPSEP